MPELPEVENARRILLRAELPGRSITRANVGWAPTVKLPSLEDFVLGLPLKQILSVNRRGKYILLPLDSDETFIIHLGMTGGVSVQPSDREVDPMVRHTFSLDDGRVLWFRDSRKFGHLWLTSDLPSTLPPLGPEPLSDDLTVDYLSARFRDRNAPAKALLLEQSVVAGLGNLYVDESLFQAHINPTRKAGGLTTAELESLKDCIVNSLTIAIAIYDRARDEHWPDPPSALHTWTVPRTEGEPCPKCGTPIVALRVRARGTFLCPSCQPPES
ncbi:MAG: DNA-formamidopyrimidine glycosylase [Chloroflexota bacterium]|nr:DNA-formamidopyrimidine glycosylase [Chloroflexota bacterium]